MSEEEMTALVARCKAAQVEDSNDEEIEALWAALAKALERWPEVSVVDQCDSIKMTAGGAMRCKKPAGHRYQHAASGRAWDKEGW